MLIRKLSYRIFVVIMLFSIMNLSVVIAEGEKNYFEYPEMVPHESVKIQAPNISVGDIFYLNFSIQEANARLYVNIYYVPDPNPMYEVYNNNNVYGNFSLVLNVTIGGTYGIYLFNDNDFRVSVSGWWAVNLNETTTTSTSTTDTTTTSYWNDTTTWFTTQPPSDYLGVFLSILVRWVLPAIIFIAIVFMLYRICGRSEFDYLLLFQTEELKNNNTEDRSG